MKSMRKKIGDPQVKDVANQFYMASEILESLPPGSGVLIPSVIISTLTIELYLKSLIARPKEEDVRIHGPGEESSILRVEVLRKTHKLTQIFDAIDRPLRDHINTCYSRSPLAKDCGAASFRQCLAKYDRTFETRYIYEHGRHLPEHPDALGHIVSFLKEIVAGYC